ncbi:MAG: hypothetical protein OXU79_07205 [Gemmatimonadota bacterium]|nr:hypothetical protein [Gemmatimonadota bacterium]
MRGKKEEGKRKREKGRRKKEKGRKKKEKMRGDGRGKTGEKALADLFLRLACGIRRIPLLHPISPLFRLTSHRF